MKTKSNRWIDRFTVLYVLISESVLSLLLAGVLCLLEHRPFVECFMKSGPFLCLITIGGLGMYSLEALVNNYWRIRLAKEEYPIVKAIILIVINAIVFLLMDQREKALIRLIIPILMWFFYAIVCVYNKWRYS